MSKKVVKNAATTRTVEVPAEYTTVTRKNLVKKGGFTEWKEVLCGDKVDGYTIRQIQDALKSRGYDPGPIDNILGSQTKAALTKFQKENNLPVGQLDMDTLKALGIKF
jgi:peptidoglycan hydrolase-like protein with peptidoglycan-binding domain